MLVGTTGQLAMKGKVNLKEEQELLMNLADILIELFLAESLVVRNIKNDKSGKGAPKELREAIAAVFLRGATDRIRSSAMEIIGSLVREDKQDSFVVGVDKFCTYPLKKVKDLKRTIAKYMIESNSYNL